MSLLGIHGDQSNQHQADANASTAAGFRTNAGNQYNTLSNEGGANTQMFSSQVPGLISNFKANAGINQDVNGKIGNPFALTPDQQTILNGHVDDLTKRQNTAIEQLRNSLAQKGINDPRYIANAEANIRQGFGGLISQHQAAFGEQAKTDRQNALQQLMQYLQGINQVGTGQQETAAGGTANLAGQTQTAANQYQQQQNQSDANFNNSLGGLTNLVGFGSGGGFGSLPNIFGGHGATSGSGSGNNQTADYTNLGPFSADNPFTQQPAALPWASSASSNPFGAYAGNSLTDYPMFGTSPGNYGY